MITDVCLWRIKLEQRHCRCDKFRRTLITNFLTLSSPFRRAVWINHAVNVWRKVHCVWFERQKEKYLYVLTESHNRAVVAAELLRAFVRVWNHHISRNTSGEQHVLNQFFMHFLKRNSKLHKMLQCGWHLVVFTQRFHYTLLSIWKKAALRICGRLEPHGDDIKAH